MSDERAFQQYHGTPITPARHLARLEGRGFCVSFAAPEQVARCHELGPVMLDNGAFSFWRSGKATDWPRFYDWAAAWLEHDPRTWACIPDVIDGDAAANDALIDAWPYGDRGAPVWHLHEPIERLLELCDAFPRVCFGSSGQYATLQTPAWWARMREAWDALLPAGGRPECQLHMLRGMALSNGPFPFASVDSTDVARNHCRYGGDVAMMAARWATMRPADEYQPQLQLL